MNEAFVKIAKKMFAQKEIATLANGWEANQRSDR